MSTAGYGMKFGKGYLGGAPKEQEAPHQGPQEEGQGEPHHAEIHQHLQSMHEQTGKAHSHVEHHGDGRHTSHHVHEDGNIEGPHEHPDTESMQAKMQEMGEGGVTGEQNEQPDVERT